MSRTPRHLCLDRVHCPLAKTRALIRTDDPARPHVCPLAKPECTRELCEAPAPQGIGGLGIALILLLVVGCGGGVAWQQGWLPHDVIQWVSAKPAPSASSAADLDSAMKQKRDAEAAVAALRHEKERQAAELEAAKAKAEKAEKEMALAKEAAAKAEHAAAKPAPHAKPAATASTVADDLSKFFPGASAPSKP